MVSNVSFVRAFLVDSSDGPVLVCHNVCRHDPGQHLGSGIRVQEREVPAKAQVSKADMYSHVVIYVVILWCCV